MPTAKLFVSFLKLISKLEPRRAMSVARTVSAFVALLNTGMYQTTVKNLRFCFSELQEKELRRLAKESLANSFFLLFEYAYMSTWDKSNLLNLFYQVEGLDLFKDSLKRGKGVLILVPHYGNFEILEVFMGAHYSFVALYNPPKVKSLDGVISNIRQRHGGSMYPIGSAGLRAIIKELRNGKISVVLPDQVPNLNSGAIEAKFFGNKIRYMSLVYKLLRSTSSEVLIASVTRRLEQTALRYEICFEKLSDLVYSQDKTEHIKAVTDAIEAIVLRSPKQYQWEYKIFKNREGVDPYNNT